MVRRMPESVRKQVAQKVIERALAAGWEDLSAHSRSQLYGEWVLDPEIGGVVADYVPKERIRMWIKDGPMKGYTRAIRGLGPYAQFMPKTSPLEAEITVHIFGPGWRVAPLSVDVKPARFIATDGEGEVRVLWGPPSDLKHLVWAWLNTPETVDIRIVVVASQGQPLTREMKIAQERLAHRLGARIDVMTR